MTQQKGIFGTILFHVLMVLMLFYFGYTTPLPLPSEEGILINFGNTEDGKGELEPIIAPIEPVKSQSASKAEKAKDDEEIMTQDFEEAPFIEKKKKTPVKKETVKPTENKNVSQKVEPIEPVEKPREVNRKALFPSKSNTGTQEGEGETGKQGNQGNPFGSPDSKVHGPGNSGNGTTPQFSLAGRNALSLPKPAYNYQVEGKVVVEVTVDQSGNVVSAVPGARGSTTLNEFLLDAAKRAALKAKFNIQADAPTVQKGTITYHFLLQ